MLLRWLLMLGSDGKLTFYIRGHLHFLLFLSMILQLGLDLCPQQNDGLPSEPSIYSAKDMMFLFVDQSLAFKELIREVKKTKIKIIRAVKDIFMGYFLLVLKTG